MKQVDLSGEPVRDVITRLIDNAKAYARAEVVLVKRTVMAWVSLAKVSVILLVVALFLVQAALTVLAASLGFLLTRWLDFPLGFAVAGLVVLLIAGLLSWIAVSRFSKDKRP